MTKKKFYLPIAFLLGSLGFLATFIGVSLKDEINPKYYTHKDEPLFIKSAKP